MTRRVEMAVPKKVKIGAQMWDIIERSRDNDGMISDDSFGYTLQKSNTIVLDKDCPPSRKRQTLFHELFHAIRFSTGSSGIKPNMEDVMPHEVIDIWEHYFIAVYEDGMLSTLRDNPKLAEYLLQKDI